MKTWSSHGDPLNADDEYVSKICRDSSVTFVRPFIIPMSSCRMRPLSAASIGSVGVQERLNELVRLFKGRTERHKDRLVDPDASEDESPATCECVLRLQEALEVKVLCFRS